MTDTLQNIALILMVLVIIWVLSLIPYSIGRHVGYREGQIDAMTGAIYFRLEKQSNFEFKWVECEGICRYEEGE